MGRETLTFTVFGMRMDATVGYLELCALSVLYVSVFLCLLCSVSVQSINSEISGRRNVLFRRPEVAIRG